MKELWYVSCSPRNPAKIRNEVALFAKLEGEKWNKRDEKGELIVQKKFAVMLSQLEGFEGEASGKESAFSARDRVAPMKTYGFAYIDKDGIIRITKAGHELVKGGDEERIFLMQMLKWQYPSWQHKGPEYEGEDATLFCARKAGYYFMPFLLVLQVVKRVDGLTKREIAMFLLPHHRMRGLSKITSQIIKYRNAREKQKGRVGKKSYDDRTHARIFRKLYRDLLASKKSSSERKIELDKKVSNSRDVADACIRLFRYTGLFATQKDRMVLNNTKEEEINLILSRKFKLVNYYDNVDRFYHYFGDSDRPALPFYEKSFLIKRAISLRKQIEIKKASFPVAVSLDKINVSELKVLTTRQLLRKIRELTELYRALSGKQMETYLKTPSGQQDVLDFYESIVHYEVADPATFFEWNTWRAMIALDESQEIRPYLKLDDSLQPVDCARGNTADIVAEFKNYAVAIEVTLTSGRRQYMTETEPVTFHVGRCQDEENRKGRKRKVYGLFIAPNISKHTANYFWQYVSKLEVPDYGNVTVVPIDLVTWKDILLFANSIGYLRDHALGDLLAAIEKSATDSNKYDTWLSSIPKLIETWKGQL